MEDILIVIAVILFVCNIGLSMIISLQIREIAALKKAYNIKSSYTDEITEYCLECIKSQAVATEDYATAERCSKLISQLKLFSSINDHH